MRIALLMRPFVRCALAYSLTVAALLLARDARAFCGFYVGGADAKLFNNATQVVMMRGGTRTVLSMQNNYQGPPSKFAMVVPVPVVLQKENVKTLTRDVFDKIDQLAAPRLVEYWEQDPCYVEPPEEEKASDMPMAGAPRSQAAPGKSLGVKIEAQFTVGEYEVVILSAKDSTGLDTWLRNEKYNIPAGSEPYLRPYVAAGSKFFVAKVDPTKVTFKDGMATLSPLRFHYDSDTFSLPIRLGLINSGGTQDLIVHVLGANQRYEVANYKNVTIPTNFDVGENARTEFGAFYASLFDRTLEKNPGAVVTEYSWDATTCDPCPGPALDPSDFTTFGSDVLPGNKNVSASVSSADPGRVQNDPGFRALYSSLQSGSPKIAECLRRAPGASYSASMKVELAFEAKGKLTSVTDLSASALDPEISKCVVDAIKTLDPSFGGTASRQVFQISLSAYAQTPMFTVTRLHARYSKESLGEDLVFKAAAPISGGREVRSGPGGTLEHGATPASTNNFQGRYAIRHAWTGPIACKSPRRGNWGGPPDGTGIATKAAKDTAFAPRGKVQLASFVRGSIPELQVAGTAAAPSGVTASSSPSPGKPPEVGPNPGCRSCTVGAPVRSTAAFVALGLALLAVFRRRR